MSKAKDFKVVGLTFVAGYPDNLLRLGLLLEAAQKAALGWGDTSSDEPTRLPVALVRNPDNEHDSNAIEVHVPALGRRESMVGHVPRELAARLAPSLDRGDEWDAAVASVLVTPEHPDRPGLEVLVERAVTVTAE